ncbi:MAG: alpha/beta fold hydrolase [Rhodopseudomonas sp.]|nr:alpha/beta fold hydrolase [Rhodopseudomonas sp.]
MTALAAIARVTSGSAAGIDFLRRPGPGTPMMLLHGIGSRADSFMPLINALPADLDVIAWNAPGYGHSQPLGKTAPTPQTYAEALERLLDALDLRRVVLVGHSLGCLFAASFAAHRPDRVAGLALLSPALGYKVAAGAELPPNVQARIDEIEALGPTTFAATRAARLVYNPEAHPQVLEAVRDAMAAVNPAGYAQAVRALGAGDLIADAALIRSATVVAVGAEDVVTPPANARALHAALANAIDYREIADAGHALPQQAPADVAALLAQLIEPRHG